MFLFSSLYIGDADDVFYVDDKSGCLYRRDDGSVVLLPCAFEKVSVKLIKRAEDESRFVARKKARCPKSIDMKKIYNLRKPISICRMYRTGGNTGY